jgi:hypothetical protein
VIVPIEQPFDKRIEMAQSEGRTATIELSAKGLERAASVEENNFVFVCGFDEIYSTKFHAAFISPRISELLRNDPTIDRFVLEKIPRKSSKSSKSSSQLRELLRNGRLCIDESSLESLHILIENLDNPEMAESLLKFDFSRSELDSSNCISRFEMKSHHRVDNSIEKSFIASHFHELGRSSIEGLEVNDLEEILLNDSLRLESEDSLLALLISLGFDFIGLLGLVRFEHLSREGIDQFVSQISHSSLDSRLWSSICRRLRHRIVLDPEDESTFRSKVCDDSRAFDPSSSPWSGILSFLKSQCGGNVHERGIVNITSSSDGGNECYQVANHGWNSHGYTNDSAKSWIQFDFKDSSICLTDYTLKSGNTNHLLQWTIEGSNDGNAWECIDSQNTQDLNGSYVTKTFKYSSPSSHFCRYIRLTQTGKNSNGNDYFVLCNIEFFGRLRSQQTR